MCPVISYKFLMTWFLLIFKDGKGALGRAWIIMGMNVKMAHSVRVLALLARYNQALK